MLLSFRAANARSFKESIEFSLLATTVAKRETVRHIDWGGGGKPLGVLPVAAIFGANGSGKSNLLRIMDDMRSHVLHSFRSGRPGGGVPRRPFLLDSEFMSRPTRYEIEIVLNDVRWEYGFEMDSERVLEEWASWAPRGRPSLLFHRFQDTVRLGSVDRSKGRAVQELLRPNALFLSTAASANHPTLLELYEWFERNLILAEADSRPFRQALTTEMLDNPELGDRVLSLLRAADLGITGARKHELDPVMRDRLSRAVRILMGTEGDPDGNEEVPTFEGLGVRLVHRGASSEIELDATDESLGTRVWFGLVGPVVQSLADGSVLLADELDASLHPHLVAQVVRLFNDPETNPRRAQLIFNSHDSILLGDSGGDGLLGRDEVWFTEKLTDGATRLYSLADLSPRKNEAIGHRYLDGRYGAIPIISQQEFASASADLVPAEA